MKNIFIFMIVVISTISCESQTKKKKSSKKVEVVEAVEVVEVVKKIYQIPEIPALLITQDEKINYFLMNFWNKYDFRDTSLISNKSYTEQAFVEFLGALNYAKEDVIRESITKMLDSASVNEFTLANFVDINERYLNDPNSPLANETIFILFLESYIAIPNIDALSKIRPKYKLKLARKNRVGDTSIDFTYTDAKGRLSNMHKISSEMLLIFFYDPDCPVCEDIMNTLIHTQGISDLIEDNVLKIAAIYTDRDIPAWKNYISTIPKTWINGYNESGKISEENLYDLRAAPVMYLLDRDKKVILKDGQTKQIFEVLSRIEIEEGSRN